MSYVNKAAILDRQKLGPAAQVARGERTQREVAEAMQTTQNAVSDAERGKNVKLARRIIKHYAERTVEGPYYLLR